MTKAGYNWQARRGREWILVFLYRRHLVASTPSRTHGWVTCNVMHL